MGFGFNFRNTLAFVTDAADEQFVAPTDVYPVNKTIGGTAVTYGWATAGMSGRDRNSGFDRRLAGVHFFTGSKAFKVDLPTVGLWSIRISSGDAGNANASSWALFDGATQFLAGGSTTGTPLTVYDATSTAYSASTWPAGNTPVLHSFVTQQFSYMLDPGAAQPTAVTHIRLDYLGSPLLLRRRMAA